MISGTCGSVILPGRLLEHSKNRGPSSSRRRSRTCGSLCSVHLVAPTSVALSSRQDPIVLRSSSLNCCASSLPSWPHMERVASLSHQPRVLQSHWPCSQSVLVRPHSFISISSVLSRLVCASSLRSPPRSTARACASAMKAVQAKVPVTSSITWPSTRSVSRT